MVVLRYKKCSIRQKALKWLDVNEIQYQERPIKEEHPSEAESKAWYERNELPLEKFFNTSGNLYREMALKNKLSQMSEEEQSVFLATDRMLARRLLVVADDFVLTELKESGWKEKMMQGPKTGRQRKGRSFLWWLFFGEYLLQPV